LAQRLYPVAASAGGGLRGRFSGRWREVGWDNGQKRPVDDVDDQPGVVAVVFGDEALQFPPQRVAWQDAEVAADLGDHRADRLATRLGRDLLGGGQRGEIRLGLGCARGGWPRCVRRARRRCGLGSGIGVEAGGGADDPFLEYEGAVQALGDAREDQRDVGGAEGIGDDGGDAALVQAGGELLAVVDELADGVEQARGGAGWRSWVGAGGRGGHAERSAWNGRPRQDFFPYYPFDKAHP
jgi:hypothetical protein